MLNKLLQSLLVVARMLLEGEESMSEGVRQVLHKTGGFMDAAVVV